MTNQSCDFVLASGMLASHGFEDRVRAASEAGFQGFGIRNDAVRRAVREGTSLADMRAIIAHYDIGVVDLQPLMDWGLGGPKGKQSAIDEEETYRVAAALGGDHLIATGFDQVEPGYGQRGGGAGVRPPRGPRSPYEDPQPIRPDRTEVMPPPPRRSSGGYMDDPGPSSASPFDDDETEIDIPPFLRNQRRRQR